MQHRFRRVLPGGWLGQGTSLRPAAAPGGGGAAGDRAEGSGDQGQGKGN